MDKNYQKYKEQKYNAKQRGIAFELSFDEWLAVWTESGKLKRRGINKYQYVMSRFNDAGPYKIGNVEIITFSKNAKIRAAIKNKKAGGA